MQYPFKARVLVNQSSILKHPKYNRGLMVGNIITIVGRNTYNNKEYSYSVDQDGRLGYIYISDVEPFVEEAKQSSTCTCELSVLMMQGCKCGAIQRFDIDSVAPA